MEKKDTNVTTDTRRDKVNPQDDIHDALFKYTIPVQLKPSRRIGDEKRVPKWQVRNEERCGLRLKPITASQPIIIITITYSQQQRQQTQWQQKRICRNLSVGIAKSMPVANWLCNYQRYIQK